MKIKSLLIVLILTANQLWAIDLSNLNKASEIIKDSVKNKDNGIKGKFIFTPGLGFNILDVSLKYSYVRNSIWSKNHDYNYIDIKAHCTPMYHIAVDYGVNEFLTVGASFGYQTATIAIQSHYYDPNTGGSGTYVDSWTRMHFGTRVDYHIIRNKNISMYTGIKLGYNIYSMNSTLTSLIPEYKNNLSLTDVTPFRYGVQAHFGFSYYFNGIVGLNTEMGLGIGGPYLFAIGLTVKI